MHRNLIIVLAEQDEDHVRAVRKNLRRAGILNEIVQFDNGEDVLNFMLRKGTGPNRTGRRDFLLIMDTDVPGINGIEVLRQIKQDDEIQKAPVIMITSSENHEEMVQCHILGCSGYLKKPVSFRDLEKTVKETGLLTHS